MSSGLVELRSFVICSVLFVIVFSKPYVGYVVGFGGAKDFCWYFLFFLKSFSKSYVSYVVGFGGARCFLICSVLFLNCFF